jgi:hypothetical protein
VKQFLGVFAFMKVYISYVEWRSSSF